MRKYISEVPESISFETDQEFGHLDVVRVLNEIRESGTPQVFGAKKGGSIMSNIELKDGIIYFGACDGNFYAVNAKSGRELWRYPAGDVILSFSMGDDAVYVSCYDKCLHALGLDGKEMWRFKADGKLGDSLYWNGRIYFGTDGGNFYSVGKDGKLKWRFATNSIIGGFPAVHKGVVLFGDFDGKFHALDAETGRCIWTFKANGGLGGCVIHKDVLYLPCRKNVFYAIDLNGREIWRRMFNKSLVVDNHYKPYGNVVFASSMEGGLYALKANNGEAVWSFNTPEAVVIFIVKSGDAIYFGDLSGRFYAAEAATGKLIWSFSTNGPNTGGVVVHDDKVYFGSWDCNAYCLDAKTGRLVWKFHTSMGNMSDYETDRRADKPELSITIQLPEEESKGAVKEEPELADYGEFSGAYIDKEKTDYVKSGKRGYIKKKDF